MILIFNSDYLNLCLIIVDLLVSFKATSALPDKLTSLPLIITS